MKKYTTLFLILLLTAFFTDASATILAKLSIDDLTLSSDVIVQGEVVEVRCEKSAEDGRLYTYNSIEVSQWEKGKTTSRIEVRQIGGTVDGLSMWIPGTPKLQKGRKVLLFLKNENDRFFLRGMGQGLFTVETIDGIPTAIQGLSGASLYEKKAADSKGKITEGIDIKMPLPDLLAQVRQTLKTAP